jgi:hypothetical protein
MDTDTAPKRATVGDEIRVPNPPAICLGRVLSEGHRLTVVDTYSDHSGEGALVLALNVAGNLMDFKVPHSCYELLAERPAADNSIYVGGRNHA